MNKKKELKKLLEQQKEDYGMFNMGMNKKHFLFGLFFSPLYIMLIISEWAFRIFDYSSEGTPPEIFRPVALAIGIFLLFWSWYNYKKKVRYEKETQRKIDKLITELKE